MHSVPVMKVSETVSVLECESVLSIRSCSGFKKTHMGKNIVCFLRFVLFVFSGSFCLFLPQGRRIYGKNQQCGRDRIVDCIKLTSIYGMHVT